MAAVVVGLATCLFIGFTMKTRVVVRETKPEIAVGKKPASA
jgi:hypothetical protein